LFLPLPLRFISGQRNRRYTGRQNLLTTVYKLGIHAKGVFSGRTNVEL